MEDLTGIMGDRDSYSLCKSVHNIDITFSPLRRYPQIYPTIQGVEPGLGLVNTLESIAVSREL